MVNALIAAFMESLMPEMAKTAAVEAGTSAIADAATTAVADTVASAIPQAATQMAAPASFGQQVGSLIGNDVKTQMQPAMGMYNTFTNPNATTGDMARSAFEYSIKTKDDENNQVKNPYMANMSPYSNMANNNVGGIQSILQNTQSGLLPYFGAR